MIGPVLGIDIGAEGGLALLSSGSDGAVLLDCLDMPVLRDGPKNRPTVNAALLAAIVRRWAPRHAFVEFVSARPKESPVGAFAFGRSRGIIEGTLGSLAVPITWITPATWKRTVGLTRASKDEARSDAIRRWPDHAQWFARARDDGRAESCLIGVAGLIRSGREVERA